MDEWDEFEQSLVDRFYTAEPDCEKYKATKAYWSKYNHRSQTRRRRRRRRQYRPVFDTPKPEATRLVKTKVQDVSAIIAEIRRRGEEIRLNGYRTPVSPSISWDALRKEIEDRFCQ